jgi:hypothetical protein
VSAVVVDVSNWRDRSYERNLLRAVDGELNRWGKWHEARWDWSSYPKASATENFKTGERASQAGHRILMLDMPVGIWATHHRVMALEEELRELVSAWYIIRVKEDGTAWTPREKSERIGIPLIEWRRLLRAAQMRIAGIG